MAFRRVHRLPLDFQQWPSQVQRWPSQVQRWPSQVQRWPPQVSGGRHRSSGGRHRSSGGPQKSSSLSTTPKEPVPRTLRAASSGAAVRLCGSVPPAWLRCMLGPCCSGLLGCDFRSRAAAPDALSTGCCAPVPVAANSAALSSVRGLTATLTMLGFALQQRPSELCEGQPSPSWYIPDIATFPSGNCTRHEVSLMILAVQRQGKQSRT